MARLKLETLLLACAAASVACHAPEQPAHAKSAARPEALAVAPVPQPKVVTIGAPPAEGEIAALPPAPDAPRKRLHVVVQKDGKPLARAGLIRLFPDAGYEGFWPLSDALGRIEADIIVAQPALQLCIQADDCTRQQFELDPASMKDGETRRIDLRPGPAAVKVRFVHPCKFPQGFAVCFLSLGLLGDRRPEPDEIRRDFLGVLNHIDSRTTALRPDGTAEVPILPGRYWVWANPGNRPSGEWLEFPSCCFEVEVPEGHDAQIFYAGTLGGALVLDVLGPATIGMDVSVTVEDGADATRKLWFEVSKGNGGTIHSTDINVGTLGCRSEPIPVGEHVLVFHQRGKEIERRKVTIVRGEELKLSIKP